MDPAEAVRQEVRAWLPRLGVLAHQVTKGHIRIEALEAHRRERLYQAGMELTMPDGIVTVTQVHPSNLAHEDVYVAVRNAFRAARRELEEYFKTHDGPELPKAESYDNTSASAEQSVEMILPPAPALSPASQEGVIRLADD
jgi:hypothetical protein